MKGSERRCNSWGIALSAFMLLTACEVDTIECTASGDSAEPNDSAESARDLGEFTDFPDSEYSDDLDLATSADEDWFRFRVRDEKDANVSVDLGNPQIAVHVGWAEDTIDQDISVWFACDAGGDQLECKLGEPDTSRAEPGCRSTPKDPDKPFGKTVSVSTECDTDDDSGVALVRVSRLSAGSACEAYGLQISVE